MASVCHTSLFSNLSLGKKITPAGSINCQSPRDDSWDQSEKYVSEYWRTCHYNHQIAPQAATEPGGPVSEHPATPRGCAPWPATPAFRVNIGRNDTLGERGCYYGLPTTQRSSVPPRPEEGRRCFHPDQNDRRDFIPTFLQRVSGGEGLENPLPRVLSGPTQTSGLFQSVISIFFSWGVKRPHLCGLTSAEHGWLKTAQEQQDVSHWREMEPRLLLIRDYQNQGVQENVPL